MGITMIIKGMTENGADLGNVKESNDILSKVFVVLTWNIDRGWLLCLYIFLACIQRDFYDRVILCQTNVTDCYCCSFVSFRVF